MTAGFPSDGADNAIHADIVAVGYGAPTGLSGMLTPGSEISLQATTPCCTGDDIRNQNGTAVIVPITTGSTAQDKGEATWIVRRGLADPSGVSFESRNNPGDFLRHQNSVLRLQPFDGTALNRSDATFCPQPGKNGKGIHSTPSITRRNSSATSTARSTSPATAARTFRTPPRCGPTTPASSLRRPGRRNIQLPR